MKETDKNNQNIIQLVPYNTQCYQQAINLVGINNSCKTYQNSYSIYLTDNTPCNTNQKDIPIGLTELKVYKDINTNLTFLLLSYIVIFEEYRNQHIASNIISSIINLDTFQNETIHYIVGESTKNANEFWNKQVNINNGFTIDYTFCINTTCTFFIPTKHTTNNTTTLQGDILKQKQLITNVVPTLLEYTYLDNAS